MDADEHGLAVVDVAFHESEMVLVADFGLVEMQLEIAKISGHLDHLRALHEAFALAAIINESLNGADLQPVLTGKDLQLGQVRRFAVFTEDFTNHARWLQSRDARQINGRFGMPRTAEDAAGLGHEREDVPWLHEVGGAGRRVGEETDRA